MSITAKLILLLSILAIIVAGCSGGGSSKPKIRPTQTKIPTITDVPVKANTPTPKPDTQKEEPTESPKSDKSQPTEKPTITAIITNPTATDQPVGASPEITQVHIDLSQPPRIPPDVPAYLGSFAGGGGSPFTVTIEELMEEYPPDLDPLERVQIWVYDEYENQKYRLITVIETQASAEGKIKLDIDNRDEVEMFFIVIYSLDNREIVNDYSEYNYSGSGHNLVDIATREYLTEDRMYKSPLGWEPCPGTYYSQFTIGDIGHIDSKDRSTFQPNNVRNQPDLNADIVGQLDYWEDVEILEGPACHDGMVWWKVRSLDTGLVGWTSEGDDNEYWIWFGPAPEPG